MPLFLLSLLTMISCRGINKIPYKDSLPVAAQNEIVPVNLKRIARVTGAALKKDNCPSPNNTAVRYNVGGTDLGIAWDMGKGIKGLFLEIPMGAILYRVRVGQAMQQAGVPTSLHFQQMKTCRMDSPFRVCCLIKGRRQRK